MPRTPHFVAGAPLFSFHVVFACTVGEPLRRRVLYHPMCILLKLDYAKFGVSNLRFTNVIEEKPLVGWVDPPLVLFLNDLEDFLKENGASGIVLGCTYIFITIYG